MSAYEMIEALNNVGLVQSIDFKVWRGSDWNDIQEIEYCGFILWKKV